MMYKFSITLGDYIGSITDMCGSDEYQTFIIESNKSVGEVREIHFLMEEKFNIKIDRKSVV